MIAMNTKIKAIKIKENLFRENLIFKELNNSEKLPTRERLLSVHFFGGIWPELESSHPKQLRFASRFEPLCLLHLAHFDTRQKPNCWLFCKIFLRKIWPELEPLSQRPSVALSAGAAVSRGLRTQTSGSTRFQTKAKQVAFFLSNFFWTKKIGQDWNRTSDTRIFSPLLYRLSYLAKE